MLVFFQNWHKRSPVTRNSLRVAMTALVTFFLSKQKYFSAQLIMEIKTNHNEFVSSLKILY